MSSGTGRQTQSTGKLPYNDSNWGGPNSRNSNLSSPLSNPDNWPKLGTQQGDTQQQQFAENTSNMQQQAEPTGWGPPPSNPPASGWGMPPAQQQTQQQANPTGWGASANGSNNWSRQPQIDNGTSLWGKQNQSGSGWGATAPAPAPAWNTASPDNNPDPNTASQGSNGTPQAEERNTQAQPNSHSSNSATTVQQQPDSWAAAAAAPPAHAQTGQAPPAASTEKPQTSEPSEPATVPTPPQSEQDRGKDTDSSSTSSGPVNPTDQLQKLVNSHEGWGKTPVQQNTSWNIAECPNFVVLPANKTGTEAWGKASAVKPNSGWQGAGGQPNPDNAQPQWGAAPTSNPPVRGWNNTPTQSPMQQRPPWNPIQQANARPPPQSGWGDSRLPSPASAMNPNRWSTPNNQVPNNGTQNWGNPTSNHQQAGWTGSGDSGGGWGANVQRNPPPQAGNPNWGVPPQRPDGNWNQPPNMQRPSGSVDDGTSAWGDPKAYKSVNLWDKKSNPSSNPAVNEAAQNKPESTGWGNPPPPSSNNKPASSGWGEVNPAKTIDDGTSNWNKGGSNWDQNAGWGISKPDPNNGWGGNADNQSSQWGQADNDPSRTKGKDFGYAGVDRKTSTGSDNVFEEGQLERNVNGMINEIGNVSGYRQYGGLPQGNSKMPGLNGPRPLNSSQNLMGMQNQFRQPPPQLPPQLQGQIRQAVMNGIIPPEIMSPQLMTPQHLNHVQNLVMKTQDYQNLSSRMNALHKQMNIPSQVKNQQFEQISRGLKQLQSQIQQHQRALTQNLMQKQAENNNLGGMGPNSGHRLDLPPSAMQQNNVMPPKNSNMFNMSGMSQNLPNPGNVGSREQQSRLHSWRRPSAGFDTDLVNPNSVLNPMMQQSISEMIGNAGLLTQPDQGNLLGLQQDRASDIMSHEMKMMDPMMGASQSLDQEQDPSNLKNILADIGPPEFIPGKKWAGFRPIDPENDPDITPGSVASAKAMSVNTVKDIDQVLNRERYTVPQNASTALTEAAISSKNQPALASSFANMSNENPAMQSSWSSGSRWIENNKTWMVVSQISPQVELSTLKNLCSMNQKMVAFQPSSVRGIVLVKYQSSGDATQMKNNLNQAFAGMFSIALASDQEVGSFLNNGNNGWNPGSSGRRLFNPTGAMLGAGQQPGFGGGPAMPGDGAGYPGGGGEPQNLWSTGDNGSAAVHNPQQWSAGGGHAGGRPGMWGGYEQPRGVSPHGLLPENLLGEQLM